MRQFKVEDLGQEPLVYQGFNKDWESAPYLVTVIADGEIELWGMDKPDAGIKELWRYYCHDFETDNPPIRFHMWNKL